MIRSAPEIAVTLIGASDIAHRLPERTIVIGSSIPPIAQMLHDGSNPLARDSSPLPFAGSNPRTMRRLGTEPWNSRTIPTQEILLPGFAPFRTTSLGSNWTDG